MRLFIALLGVLVLLPWASAADWPHWRGPKRNGHVTEPVRFEPGKWPGSPAWSARVGEGSASPLVVGEHVYTVGWNKDRDVLKCLELSTGKPVWEAGFPARRHSRHAEGDEGLYSGPTATPEYDAEHGRLYLLGCDGWLRGLDARQRGKELWSLNLYDHYGVPKRPKVRRSGVRDYGYTSSPLVYNEWLLIEVGAREGLVMAFDKHTGRQLWTSEHAEPAGHTGACVQLSVEGVPCLAVLAKNLVVLRLDDPPGRTLAAFAWETEWANNILTPTVHQSSVLISSYHTHHAIARLDVTLQGIQERWKQPYASHVGSPVIDGEHVYLCGSELNCLDWRTGRRLWSGGSFADGGSLIKTADDRLLVLGSNGILALVETARRAPDKYQPLAQTRKLFSTDAWPHVVLAHGRILCKDRAGNLVCFAP